MKSTLHRFFLLVFALVVPGYFIGQTIDRLPCVDKTFAVVVHIAKDQNGDANIDEADILSYFETVNEIYSPVCIAFEVCEFRYIENDMYDTIKDKNRWKEIQVLHHVENRINVFYASVLKYPSPTACGFAGLGAIANFNSNGIVIKKDNCGSSTLAHELGHYFGLSHTFEPDGGMSSTERVDGSNCSTTGDKICDTPADPFVEGDDPGTYVDGCTFISMKKDANGEYYNPMVGNIMSYYPSSCRCGFTRGQYEKIVATYLAKTGMW